MKNYVFTELQGSEGALTFNFFCESLITAFHTLLHVMDDANLDLPEKAADIPDALSSMGGNLMEDYQHEHVDLGRFKNEILDFYDLAFAVSDELANEIMKEEDLQYYYYIYMQGLYLFFPNMMQAFSADIGDERLIGFLKDMTSEFHQLAGKVN